MVLKLPLVDNFVVRDKKRKLLGKHKELQGKNIKPIINILGEHYSKEEYCDNDMKKYVDTVEYLKAKNVNEIELSIKPSQLGVEIDEEVLYDKTTSVLDNLEKDDFMWMDMENENSIDDTINTYEKLVSSYPNQVGLCLQANMKRTKYDISQLLDYDSKIRLVKGAYRGDMTGKEKDSNYVHLINKFYEEDKEEKLEIGTHDHTIIEFLKSSSMPTPEVQMLMGVREKYQEELAKENTVKQYVPCGSKWVRYFYRRIRENPKNIKYVKG